MEAHANRLERRTSSKLRLLHVTHLLDASAGGAVTAVKSTCAALAGRGHDVTLFATGAKAYEEYGSYQTKVFRTEFPPMAVSVDFFRALGQMKDVDLVHIHLLYRFPQTATAFFCRRYGIPYCIQPHGCLDPVVYHKRERRIVKRLYEAMIENRNLRHAAGLIYTAEGERAAGEFLRLPVPSFIVPLSLQLPNPDAAAKDIRSRLGLEGKELILWMGRLVPVKGLDVLVKAFGMLVRNRPNAVLVLVGPDPENHASLLRRLMAEFELPPDRVIFTGLLQGGEKLAILKEADLFVLPSYTENFAIAAVEAMAMGCPVIVSNGVKIAPDIAAAGAGLVVPPQAEELKTAMHDLMNNTEMRRRMGKAAQIFARRYDGPAVVGRLEDAYRNMILP